jgi:hypothetical protein
LSDPNNSVVTPALRTIGNIITGSDDQTQYIINLNVIGPLLHLLDHNKKNIRKEACWTISNITAGTQGQIQSVIDADVVPKLLDLLRTDVFDIQKEAIWAFSNATSEKATEEQLSHLAHHGLVETLCNEVEKIKDEKVIMISLTALYNIVKVDLLNPFFNIGCLTKIEELEEHFFLNYEIVQEARLIKKQNKWVRRKSWVVVISPFIKGDGMYKIKDSPLQKIFNMAGLVEHITGYV